MARRRSNNKTLDWRFALLAMFIVTSLTACSGGGSGGGGPVAPSSTGFANDPATYMVGVMIADNPLGVDTGGQPITAVSVAPALPAGLTFDIDAVLRGTPTAIAPAADYTVTVTTAGGDVNATINITVTEQAPTGLSYPAGGVVAGLNIPLAPVVPTVGGGAATFSIQPPMLPAGLMFDPATGAISGTGTTETPATIYTVTATNGGGSESVDVSIAVLGNPQVVGNARFVDINANGIADTGDQVVLVFDQQITIGAGDLTDLELPVTDDSFGTGATLADGGLGNEIVVELGDNATLNVRGEFDAMDVDADSSSGVSLTNASGEIRNPLTTLVADPALELDLQPGFGSSPTPIASNVRGIAPADFDRDGDVDIFAIGATNRVLDNDGTGAFTALTPTGIGSVLDDEAADIDNDGDVDLVFAGPMGSTSTALNDGSGTLTAATFRTGDSTLVETCDLDRDGDVDWLLATAGGFMIMVNATNGAGGELLVATVEAPTALETADVDRDGDSDVIVGFATADVEIFLNDGNGMLMSSTTLPVQGVNDLLAIDRDVDAAIDLVVTSGASLTIFNGDGAGNLVQDFQSTDLRNFAVSVDIDDNGLSDFATATATGSQVLFADAASNLTTLRQELPEAVSGDSGDFDRDGDSDLLLITPSDELFIVRGSVTGARGIVDLVELPDALNDDLAFGGALGDLDGDGDLDLVIARTDFGGMPAGAALYLGDRNGGFVLAQEFADGSSGDIGLVDADRDGDLDVFVAQRDRANELWLNNGTGSLNPAAVLFPNNVSTSVEVGDVNRDGIDDLVVGNEGPNTIWLGNGLGGFTSGGDATLSAFTRDLELADFDKDGDLDLFDGTSLGRFNRLYLNDGSGNFSELPQLDIADVQSLAAGDLNRDGNLDLVFGLTLTGLVPAGNTVYLGDGAGGFSLQTTFTELTATNSVDVVDIDGDGILDLFEVGADGDTLRRGDGLGGFGALEILPGMSTSTTFTTCGDLDVAGDMDLVRFRIGVTGTVALED